MFRLKISKTAKDGAYVPPLLHVGPLITRIHAMEVVFLQLTVTETLTEK